MTIYDRKRRIERLEKLYKVLNDEETDIIAEYEGEYGEHDKWDEDTQACFDNLHSMLKSAMDNVWNMKEGIRQGFL